MDIKNIYNIAQRAMGAQLVRLNATASNLANADNIASSPQDAYKPVKPVLKQNIFDIIRKRGISTVDAVTVKKMDIDPIKSSNPDIQWQIKMGLFIEHLLISKKNMLICLKHQDNIKIMLKLYQLLEH